MPLYEFHCLNCDTEFEELVFSQTELPPCPHCSSRNTEKLISRQSSGSALDIPSMSSQPSGGCAGCSGGSCATCGH